MTKRAASRDRKQEATTSTLAMSVATQQLMLPLLLAMDATKRGLLAFVQQMGMAVLAELLPRYVERQVYEAMLEAIASEQSARMVAMRNATDNANELVRDLTLEYNKARQESITSELLDITGGVEALRAE